jgi:CheY-like chemotaxis protein
MARILLVDDDPASRLTLQTVLQAGGYWVEAAASAAEAVRKLDEGQYELVLTDLRMESPEAGYRVLAHSRIMEYRPATAVITTYRDSYVREDAPADEPVLIAPEQIPELLSKVADLIAKRATKRVARALRHTG